MKFLVSSYDGAEIHLDKKRAIRSGRVLFLIRVAMRHRLSVCRPTGKYATSTVRISPGKFYKGESQEKKLLPRLEFFYFHSPLN